MVAKSWLVSNAQYWCSWHQYRNYLILANGALFRRDQHRNSRILGNAKCINNTNSINCNPAGSCIDSFLYLWESEKVLLSETTCQKACSPGFALIESKCQECGPGTSKNYSGNTACTECEAGKYNNVSKSITCLECPDSYFSKTKTLWAPCCKTDTIYRLGSDCYKPGHYIVENMCLHNKNNINIIKCNQSAVLPPAANFTWIVEGIEHCSKFATSKNTCNSSSYSDSTRCVNCLRHDSPGKMQYFNRMCGTTQSGIYMANSCANNLNTMCVNCPVSAKLMVLERATSQMITWRKRRNASRSANHAMAYFMSIHSQRLLICYRCRCPFCQTF